jgi:hypothetical protein
MNDDLIWEMNNRCRVRDSYQASIQHYNNLTRGHVVSDRETSEGTEVKYSSGELWLFVKNGAHRLLA